MHLHIVSCDSDTWVVNHESLNLFCFSGKGEKKKKKHDSLKLKKKKKPGANGEKTGTNDQVTGKEIRRQVVERRGPKTAVPASSSKIRVQPT